MGNIQQTSNRLIVVALSITFLYLGKDLLIPFIFAAILWLLMRKIRSLFYTLKVSDRYFPRRLKTLFSTLLLLSSIWGVGYIFEQNIQALSNHYQTYLNNLNALITQLPKAAQQFINEYTTESKLSDMLSTFITTALLSLKSIVSSAVIVLIYLLFILFEESSFSLKIKAIYQKKEDYDSRLSDIDRIEEAVTNYLGIKSMLAICSAIICYIVFISFGLQVPFLWALLIFLLSFIPFFGIIISAFLPAVLALAQFGSFGEALAILLIVGGIQFLMGNLVEPKLMGNSMNVSPLVVLFALSFWGMIWGIPGMFLSVPLTVIMVIIFSKFPATRNIAIILSEKGNISQT
jgi:predicted PurR-regulated permease PerM